MKNLIFFSFCLFGIQFQSFSQCAAGETSVTFVMHTDAWAYENYWQLNLSGTGCNAGPIAQGANLNVGCAGTESGNSANGYDNNSTYTEGPFCLLDGTSYELIFVDSYGDGGLVIEVFENGALTHVYSGSGTGNTWNFTIGQSNIPTYDQPCTATEVIADGPTVFFNNTNAIAAYGELAPAGIDCAAFGFWCEGNSTNSVWAKFTPTTSNTSYEITTCNSGTDTDTQIAVWRATNCADFSTYELIGSNDDMLGGCSNGEYYASTTYTSCLEAGQTYYIQIDGWEGAVGNIELSVLTFQNTDELQALVNSVTCPLEKGDSGDGSIFPYIIGAGINFTSSWTSNNGFTSTNQNIQNIDPGIYTLTATTACGVVLTGQYTISIPEPWLISTSITNPSCGAENGQIDVSASGATAPYVFSWTDVSGLPLSSNNPITNIGLGTYNMVITDDLGCTFNYTFNVSDCVGIEEQTDLNNYLIYPNPSQGVMKINHKVGICGTLIIFNQLGEVVFTDKINSAGNQTQLNTNLSSGIYMLHIQENSGNILTFPIEIAR